MSATHKLCQSLRTAAVRRGGVRPLYLASPPGVPACALLDQAHARGVSILRVARPDTAEAALCLCNDTQENLLLRESLVVAAGDVRIRISADQIVPAGRTLLVDHVLAEPERRPDVELAARVVPASATEIPVGMARGGHRAGTGGRQGVERRSHRSERNAAAALHGPSGWLRDTEDGGLHVEMVVHPHHRPIEVAAEDGGREGAEGAGELCDLCLPAELLEEKAWTTRPDPSGAVRCEVDLAGTRLRALVWRGSALTLRGVIAAGHARTMALR